MPMPAAEMINNRRAVSRQLLCGLAHGVLDNNQTNHLGLHGWLGAWQPPSLGRRWQPADDNEMLVASSIN